MRWGLVTMSVIAGLACIALPIVLGAGLRKRLGTRWWLFILGALSFIASQVVHIPLLMGVDAAIKAWLPPPPPSWGVWLTPVLLGFFAGVCEEPARWIALRFVLRRDEDRGREGALMLGAGHGGIEAMFVGVMVFLSVINVFIMREVDAQGLIALSMGQLDETAAQAVVAQVAEYWALPLYMPLVAPFERIVALALHVSMSALVAHGVRRRLFWPLALAIAWHAAIDAVAVFGASRWDPIVLELVIAGMAFPVCAAVIVWTWRAGAPVASSEAPDSSEAPESPQASPEAAQAVEEQDPVDPAS